MFLPFEAAAPGIREVTEAARHRLVEVPADVRPRLLAALRDDMVTEYDARFLVDYLERLDVPLCDEFRGMLTRWYADEVRHFSSFRCVVETLLGENATDELEARRPDFGAVAHLFRGEFEILCLLAYDELATLRGYRGNLPMYDLLGERLGALVRRVIGDEAGHYAGFRALLIEKHGHRLDEVEDVVREIRSSEGTPYQATFVLDHDDPVYGDHIFDDAARVLVGQMRREQNRAATPA
ncbi:MAG: hypothetical protein P8R42_26035 [Candidatus Binatia bacterium]|nr:hypothetical protein [Candidatus Binatia bacterium]